MCCGPDLKKIVKFDFFSIATVDSNLGVFVDIHRLEVASLDLTCLLFCAWLDDIWYVVDIACILNPRSRSLIP